MDRYRTIAARFSRRRLLAIAVSFAGALAFVFLGGDFTPAEMRASVLVALAAVLVFPLTQTIALHRALAPVREAIATERGDATAIALRLRTLPLPFIIFLADRVLRDRGRRVHRAATRSPACRSRATSPTPRIGALLCWAMYATLLGLAFEHALADFAALAAEALGQPSRHRASHWAASPAASRLVIVVTVTFVTAVTGIITLHGGNRIAFAITGAVVVIYGALAAIFLAESIAAPLSRIARALDRVSEGDLEALAELRTLPRVPHEAGAVLHALAGAETSLRDTSDAAARLANGDLTTRIEPRSSGDFLGHALASLLAAVRDVLNDARSAAVALDDGSLQADANAARLHGVAAGISDDLRAASASVERLERATAEAGGASVDVATAVATVRTSADHLEDTVRDTAAALEELAHSVERGADIAARDPRPRPLRRDDRRRRRASPDRSNIVERPRRNRTGNDARRHRSPARRLRTHRRDHANDRRNLGPNKLTRAERRNRSRPRRRARPRLRRRSRRDPQPSPNARVQANNEIAELVRDVQKRTGTAVASTREGDTAARTARDATSAAARALETIRTDVGEVARQLDDVGRATAEQQENDERPRPRHDGSPRPSRPKPRRRRQPGRTRPTARQHRQRRRASGEQKRKTASQHSSAQAKTSRWKPRCSAELTRHCAAPRQR